MKKIIILTAKTGGGHLSLTQSVINSLNKYFPNKYKIITHFPNPLNFAYIHNNIFTGNLPIIWNIIWVLTNNSLGYYLISIFYPSKKLKRFLKTQNPYLVISNNPIVIGSLVRIKKKLNLKFKIVVHIADPFAIHKAWYGAKNNVYYLCPTNTAKKILIKNGINKKNIFFTGWSIREPFFKDAANFKNIKKLHHIKNKSFLIFLSASSGKKSVYLNFINNFIKHKLYKKSHLIINCGNNFNYIKAIKNKIKQYKNRIILIPYIKNMEDYIYNSNLIIGKAGPNFLFEVLYLNKPLILISYVPGQEKANVDFAIKNKFAWYAPKPKQYLPIIKSLINNKKTFYLNFRKLEKFTIKHKSTNKKVACAINKIVGTI